MALLNGETVSQFPFWDFGECNEYISTEFHNPELIDSQFPLWDFGECNPKDILGREKCPRCSQLSIPFVGFR